MAPEKQKPTKSESSSSTAASAQETSASKPITITSSALEEDDEFEDFPVDDWQPEDSEAQTNNGPAQEHLWEESWDDDDAADDFSNQLREELKKVDSTKRR